MIHSLFLVDLVEHGNTVFGKHNNYFGIGGGPTLVLVHRSDGEVEFQNPTLIGFIERSCHLTAAHDPLHSGPFGTTFSSSLN